MLSFRCVVLYSCLILFLFFFLSLADEIKLLNFGTITIKLMSYLAETDASSSLNISNRILVVAAAAGLY